MRLSSTSSTTSTSGIPGSTPSMVSLGFNADQTLALESKRRRAEECYASAPAGRNATARRSGPTFDRRLSADLHFVLHGFVEEEHALTRLAEGGDRFDLPLLFDLQLVGLLRDLALHLGLDLAADVRAVGAAHE